MDGEWWAITTSVKQQNISFETITSDRLITCNIDFMAPFAEAGVASALNYLESVISSIPKSQAAVISLQEMVGSDLKQIGNTPWVRGPFSLTDCTSLNWGSSSYGAVTLLYRCLSVKQVSRLRYVSEYLRNGLLVDLAIHKRFGEAAEPTLQKRILRLCNTHLDSMASNPPLRPLRIKGVEKYFHDDVYPGVLINPWIERYLKRMDSRMRILNLGVKKMLKGDALGVSRAKRWRENDMGPLGWIRCYIVVGLKLGVWKG